MRTATTRSDHMQAQMHSCPAGSSDHTDTPQGLAKWRDAVVGKKHTFILIIFLLLPFLCLYTLYIDIYFLIYALQKDSDAGRDWRQEEKGTTEDEMAGWHH